MYNIPKGWKVYNEKCYKKNCRFYNLWCFAFEYGWPADTSWSVKRNDDETFSVGTYIYYMTQAYSEAKEKTGKSGNVVLSETIDKETGDQWIRDRAKELCVEQMTLDKLCKDNKINITDDEINATYTDKSAFYGYYHILRICGLCLSKAMRLRVFPKIHIRTQ